MKHTATHTNETAGFEMILQELLPYSFTKTTNSSTRKKKNSYRTWAELHSLLYGFWGNRNCWKSHWKILKKSQKWHFLFHHSCCCRGELKNGNFVNHINVQFSYLKKYVHIYKNDFKTHHEWDAFIISQSPIPFTSACTTRGITRKEN